MTTAQHQARRDDTSDDENMQHGAVDHARVIELAHGKFMARGGEHGHDVEDWLAAEAEVRRSTTAGHGSESAPTAQATAREAERHAREASEGHFAAGVDGRLKASDSKTSNAKADRSRV